MLKDKTRRIKINLYVDIVLLIAFLVLLKPFTTGIAIHEWLGLAMGAGLALHIVLHWRWIVSITQKLFCKLPTKIRIYYTLDALLLFTFTVTLITGILMSQVVLPLLGLRGIFLFPLPFVHEWASYVTLALLAVKLVLHWDWIKCAFKRPVRKPQCATDAALPLSPAVAQSCVPLKLSRRRFLLICGSAACVAALACLTRRKPVENDSTIAANDNTAEKTASTVASTPVAHTPTSTVPTESAETATSEPVATATPEPTATATAVPTATPAPQRVVTRCPFGRINDPYPGHCRRYVDKNGNGFCDLSETA